MRDPERLWVKRPRDPLTRLVDRVDREVRDIRKELSNSNGRPRTT
jgi:hypothetical protein